MLLDTIRQQCRQQAEALALQEKDRCISYAQLWQYTESIATTLQVQGVAPGQPVIIYLERGIDAVLAALGVLLAGGCYVPLDIKNPPQRLAFIIDDAQAAAVIGIGEPPPWLKQPVWLDLSNCLATQPAMKHVEDTSLAAILYTSGSTGQPRGVALSHKAIAAFTDWASQLVDLKPADRIANSTPLFFDLSTFDLYAVLGRGASLHFVPANLTMAPARLSRWLDDTAITGWYTVPSMLTFLVYKGRLSESNLRRLRFLFFAGEVFPTPALMELVDNLPQTALYNLFGPTETNVCCYWQVDRAELQVDKNIPIGQAAAGCELTIQADTGALQVRGTTLASGYWNKGQLQPFLNPEGWYETGDYVSLANDQFLFHGRLGRMLKCSGYRVEPAEIEAVVCSMPGIRECAVVGIPDATAGQRPALAVCPAEINMSDIRQSLLQMLPIYMQPIKYLRLDTLPRLANGKLDYQALKALFNLTT